MLEQLFIPAPELVQPKSPIAIVQEIRSSRKGFLLAQTNPKEKPRTQTIEIPADYTVILCHKDYICISKTQYNGQPVAPSTVNSVPQATITSPNPNFNPNQQPNINQFNPTLNSSSGQSAAQFGSVPGGSGLNQQFSPSQGYNPSIGQLGVGGPFRKIMNEAGLEPISI